MAALVARLATQGRRLGDVLDELAVAHGVYATDAFSVRVTDVAVIGQIMARLRAAAPATREIAGVAVAALDDLEQPTNGLPPTDGLRYLLADESRVIVRPSGTEPKLKVYLEAIVPVAGGAAGLDAARTETATRLGALRSALEDMTSR